MNQTPLITAAAVTTGVTLLIALLVSFGVHLTPEQQTAIAAFVAFVAPWVVALVGHNTTTPLSNPRDETGAELVRKVDGMPTRGAVRSMARGK